MSQLKLTISCDVDTIRKALDSGEKYSAFLQALGRQVFYGLTYGGDESNTESNGFIFIESGMYPAIERSFSYSIEGSSHKLVVVGLSDSDMTKYSFNS